MLPGQFDFGVGEFRACRLAVKAVSSVIQETARAFAAKLLDEAAGTSLEFAGLRSGLTTSC